MTELQRARTRPDDPGLIGQVLGSYRIDAPLSTGGMGAVYRATHETLGRAVAIKVLRPELTDHQEMVERFFLEAKAASAIRHPGIIETYDFGYTADGLAYIVMELLEGQSLAHRLRGATRLPELPAAAIARGVASALVAAHAKGIIHRDLKPDNVFLVPDPEAAYGERTKLLDFGIAKLINPLGDEARRTQTGALIGTPLYMAPEQARAATDIDARADLYSLGCILYELLTGAPPFVAEGAGEIIAMQMFSPPEPPSAKLPRLAPELERITLRLLEKEPEARYGTAAEVADALGALLGRLSNRLMTVVPTSGASLPDALFTPPPAPAPSAIGVDRAPRGPLLEDAPPPAHRRAGPMPFIAAALTLGLAGGVAALVWTRGESAPPPSVAPPIPVAAPVTPTPTPTPPPTAPSVPPPAPVAQATPTPTHAPPPRPRPPATSHAAPTTPPPASGPTLVPEHGGPTTTIPHETAPTPDREHSAGHSPIAPDLGDDKAPGAQ